MFAFRLMFRFVSGFVSLRADAAHRCVEGKADGLREGDECVDEAEAYKKCRQLVKEAKGQGAKTASTGAATADDKKQQPR